MAAIAVRRQVTARQLLDLATTIRWEHRSCWILPGVPVIVGVPGVSAMMLHNKVDLPDVDARRSLDDLAIDSETTGGDLMVPALGMQECSDVKLRAAPPHRGQPITLA